LQRSGGDRHPSRTRTPPESRPSPPARSGITASRCAGRTRGPSMSRATGRSTVSPAIRSATPGQSMRTGRPPGLWHRCPRGAGPRRSRPMGIVWPACSPAR